MKSTFRNLLTVATICASALTVMAQTDQDNTTLRQFAGYQLWTRVNEQPVVVPVSDVGTTGI